MWINPEQSLYKFRATMESSDEKARAMYTEARAMYTEIRDILQPLKVIMLLYDWPLQ